MVLKVLENIPFTDFDHSVQAVNEAIAAHNSGGRELYVTFNGRPRYEVISPEDGLIDIHGRVWNRGPLLVGRFGLRQLMVETRRLSGDNNYGQRAVVVMETPAGHMFGHPLRPDEYQRTAASILATPRTSRPLWPLRTV